MAKASDNVFPKVIHGMQTSDPSAPADSSWKTYAKADGIYARSSNAVVGPFGTATNFTAAGSNSKDVSGRSFAGASTTLLAPFDHEHLGVVAITSSSSNTLQRPTVNLRPGTNIGFALSDADGNGAFDTLTITAAGGSGGGSATAPFQVGTAFPGSPATNDFFFRTDLARVYRYDGTRWVTDQEYTANVGAEAVAATTNSISIAVPNGSTGIYVTTIDVSTFVNGTSDGTHFWTIQANKTSTANANTSLGSFTTASDTTVTWTQHTIAVNAVVTGSTHPRMDFDLTKTSTAGNLYYGATIRYRWVAT